MSRIALCITFFCTIAAMGCAHGPVHVQTELVPSTNQSHVIEAGYAGRGNRLSTSEDGYVYAVGLGKFPDDSISQAQGWARAKRAAVDNAIMNLIAEAEKKDGPAAPDASHSNAPENGIGPPAGQVRGAVSQAEIVRIHRLPDGSC